MASWLKAAEDLFEVVDRQAKLVVSELSDEQKQNIASASNGPASKSNRAKQRKKAVRHLSSETSSDVAPTNEPANNRVPSPDAESDRSLPMGSIEKEESQSQKDIYPAVGEQLNRTDVESPTVSFPFQESEGRDNMNQESQNESISAPQTIVENSDLTSNNGPAIEVAPNVSDDYPQSTQPAEVLNADEAQSVNSEQNHEMQETSVLTAADQEKSGPVENEVSISNGSSNVETDQKVEPSDSRKTVTDQKENTPSVKLQDQLDEAQGLLKNTVSRGQSKEARLARVCAGLQSRLQELKTENSQLEELLTSERELSKSYEAHIKQLQKDLSVAKSEATKVESSMSEALAAKNSEIETLIRSVDALKTQLASAEGNQASLQANMESIMRNRELTETRMMQALREELASVERQAEEERIAHSATKKAAMEREVELEHRAVEASTALAKVQRSVDERTSRMTDLEQQKALLEVENSSLNQELHELEARVRREQKKFPEEANKVIQMQALQEEVAAARQSQRNAESKASNLEAELQKMKVEVAAIKKDAEHYSREEHMELEKRYRELTDLLYYKQTQLEAMATEKAAAEFQLEKEVKRMQEAKAEVERSRVSRRPSSTWEEDSEMRGLETLPLHHRHLVGASMQLQKVAKILDTGAARATRFLWRYPTARLITLFYLVFVHLFLMYLMHRLQEQADNLSAQEIAESMGLSNPTLP
ncbi:hypothetical protein MLD38_006589 [Melastoma candidum]|uniref:Uncharacterized protein n=1 Tax=Melastoma candidum TaxID=119954 RepID=A0ACB9RPE8_9MYRT|nr:hypothetical protein MLD38_006589 [Melastoma candidum]